MNTFTATVDPQLRMLDVMLEASKAVTCFVGN
jgi:hypothetical protein